MSIDTITPPPVTPPAVPAASSAPAPVSRRRRWLRRLLPPLTLLVLGVWFAPAMVAKTELRNRFARQALGELRGSVTVGSASLGWFSPVELRDVTITDEVGRAVITVPRITSEKSLLSLARNRAEPGEFALDRPTVAVVCDQNNTNLEAAFAEYLKDDATTAPTRTPVTIRVTAGTLTLTDAQTSQTTRIEDINANVTIPAKRAEPITAKLTAATGQLDADVSIADAGSANLASSSLPLDTFAPLLKRADLGVSIAGALTSNVRISWSKDAVSLAGTASAKQLVLAGSVLDGDTLRIDSAELPLDVELAGRAVRVRKFDLTCDIGTLSAAGTFDPDEPTEKLLARPGLTVKANVELAKLAAKLPKLLRVKDGTELREGRVEVTLASRADRAGVVWEGKVLTSAIKATRAGKPLNWEQPLNVEFLARFASGELPTFDKLICTSDFIAVNARITSETVQAAANVYLHRLAAHLAEFIDLGGITLDGEASAQLVGRRERTGDFAAKGVVELKNFALGDRTGKGLREPALKLNLTVSGKLPDSGPIRLASGTVMLATGNDELHLSLLEPVADLRQLSSGSVELRINGDVARWKSRAGAFVKIPAYVMSGAIVASGKARFAADRVTVDRLTVGLTNVKFRGAGLNIDEPRMNATGDFTLTRATQVASITKLALTSAPLNISAGTLTFEPHANGIIVSGNGQCTGDLNRLGTVVRLYTDPRGRDSLHGRAIGPVRFRYAGDVTTFGGTLDVTNFAYGVKDTPLWAEPTLRVEADGSYTDSTDTVALAVAKAERPGLALDAKGAIAKVTTTQDANFTGKLTYDWANLTPLVREFAGGNFTATGTGTRPVALNGQLSAPNVFAALNGEATVGWNSITAYGFDVGTSELQAKLSRGVLAITPLSATFCGGKVTLAPTVKLDPALGEVTFAKGPVVDRAKLTPKATAGALGYALPAIANAGQAEGEISASIGDNRFPLGEFTKATAAGTLVIHKATVGANPLVAEIATLLGAKNTTMTLVNESAVPVQVANGRVHHQNFAFRISGTTLRTSGSVGFDNTLDLVVDVPLPKDLPALKNNPVLQKAVAGKMLKVPVKGTLSKPALDPKAFEQAVIALARESAKDVGKDLLEKELYKLFPNMPAPTANPKPGGLLPFPLPFGKKKP